MGLKLELGQTGRPQESERETVSDCACSHPLEPIFTRAPGTRMSAGGCFWAC